jgi:dynein heavy chain, axonemal
LIARYLMELDKFQHKWIMLDGPLDPKWFESMNSILDDNQILTLANGYRIRMGPHMKLLFETSDLSNVTASTITRLGVINFSTSNN